MSVPIQQVITVAEVDACKFPIQKQVNRTTIIASAPSWSCSSNRPKQHTQSMSSKDPALIPLLPTGIEQLSTAIRDF